MAKLPFLDSYSGETLDELIATEGKYHTDSLVSAFEQAMYQKVARVGASKLSDKERVILAIEALECEVNNGGYEQFFINNSREYAPIIVSALKRIGCPKTAEIAQKAVEIIQRMPITPEEMKKADWDENKERHEALNECDQLYFEVPAKIEEHLLPFIKANRVKIEP